MLKILPWLPLTLKINFGSPSRPSGLWGLAPLPHSPPHLVTTVHLSAPSNKVTYLGKPSVPLQVVKFLSYTFLQGSDPLLMSVCIYDFVSDAGLVLSPSLDYSSPRWKARVRTQLSIAGT